MIFIKNRSRVTLFLLSSLLLNLVVHEVQAKETKKLNRSRSAADFLKTEEATYATLLVLSSSHPTKSGVYDCREGKLKEILKPHSDPKYANIAHSKEEFKDPSGNLKFIVNYDLELDANGLATLKLYSFLFPTSDSGWPVISQRIDQLSSLSLKVSASGTVNTDGTLAMEIPPREDSIDRYEVTMLINPKLNCSEWRKNYGDFDRH